MTEQQIQKKISDDFESRGYFVLKLIKTNCNGIPDLLCVKHDDTIFVEVKKPTTGKLSAIQKYRIEQLRKKGIKAVVMDGINSVIF